MRICAVALLLGTGALGWARAAQAEPITLQFERGTTNAAEDLAGQLTCLVDGDLSTVSFTFSNAIGISSSICDIYFRDTYDAWLDGAPSILASAGVAYSSGATPGHPPGLGWGGSTGYSADSDAPVEPNGVDTASEWITFTFDLASGHTWTQLAAGFANGSLDDTIGLHVQAIGTQCQSDSYRNAGVSPVPEPGTFALLGLGVVGLVLRRRRRHMA